MEYKDYYKILGVDRNATAEDIKKSYRRLARKFHPDVSKETDAEQRFKEIGEAYEVLKDPDKRQTYDQLGANWKAGQDFRPPPGWGQFDFSAARGGFAQGGFSDFFESLFGGGFAHKGGGDSLHAKGRDQQATLRISLQEAFRGTQKTIQLKNGKSLQVKIPSGILPGKQIRLAGQGECGNGQGTSGDLYLQIELIPDKTFRLQGRDVHVNLPITPWEAALGAAVKAPTLSGEVELQIPANAQSGKKLRLKGRGFPGKTPGDQYVELQIMVPPIQNEEDRSLFLQMQERFHFDPRHAL